MALTQLKTSGIADDAVTTDKLANAINTERTANTAKSTNATHTGDVTGSGALTIAADAVTSSKLADNAVVTAAINGGAVTNAKLAADAVTNAKIADDAIDSEHYVNGSIDTAHIADNAVDKDKLAHGLHLFCTGSDKGIILQGNIGEIGDVSGFQAVNDAANANTDFGIRANTIRLATTSAERVRVTDDGLTFHGDTASANALDDYEEGTFTPNFDAAGGVTFSYSHQYGYYTKVGNLVNFQLYIQGYASTITSGNHNNAVAVQGLPFTIANITRYYPAFTIGRTYKWDVNSDQRVYAYGELNTSIARIIVEEDDQTGGLLVANQLDNNTCLIHLAGAYRV